MPQFLFTVEMPASKEMSSPGYTSAWIHFENESNTTLKPVKTCTCYQKNAWLLPVENGLHVLLALSSMAEKHNLSYSDLLLESVIDLSSN